MPAVKPMSALAMQRMSSGLLVAALAAAIMSRTKGSGFAPTEVPSLVCENSTVFHRPVASISALRERWARCSLRAVEASGVAEAEVAKWMVGTFCSMKAPRMSPTLAGVASE